MNRPYHMHLHQDGVPGGLGLCRGILPDWHSGGGSSLTAGEKRILGQCSLIHTCVCLIWMWNPNLIVNAQTLSNRPINSCMQ